MFPFSKEQIDTQIKILVTSLCTIMSAVGITNSERIGEVISAVLTAAGPIAYIYVAVALYFRMSRKNILAAAATPVAPGIPPPIIVLPKEESELADGLPHNVTALQ